MRPALDDLNVSRVDELEPALHAWRHAALPLLERGGLASRSSRSSPCSRGSTRCGDALRHCRRRLELHDVWKLMQAPIDEDGLPLLGTLSCALAGDTARRRSSSGSSIRTGSTPRASRRPSRRGGKASILRWFALQYPGRRRSPSRRPQRSRRRPPRGSSRSCGRRSTTRRSPLPGLRLAHRTVGDALRPLLSWPAATGRAAPKAPPEGALTVVITGMAASARLRHHSKVTGDPTQRVLDWKLELLCVAQELDQLRPKPASPCSRPSRTSCTKTRKALVG